MISNDLKMILERQQNEIINADERKIVVSAGPGSGKTFTLVKRLEKKFNETENYKAIITSFTKEASNQLRDRTCNIDGINESYIGTLDSFIMKEIILPYKNRYLKECNLPLIKKTVNYTFPQRKSSVEILTKNGISKSSRKEILDEFHNWLINFCNGVYEISSMAYIVAIDVLKKCLSSKLYIKSKYNCIYVDEAQDLNEFQHKFIKYFIEACDLECMLIGDKNQSIYEFRGARPEQFYSLRKDEGYKVYEITVSVRCHPSILMFSNLILDANAKLIEIKKNKVFLNVPPNETNVMKVDGNFFVLFERQNDALSCYNYLSSKNVNVIYTKRLELSDTEFSNNYLDIIEELIKFKLNINNENPKLVYSIKNLEDYLENNYILKRSTKNKLRNLNNDLIFYIKMILKELNISITIDTERELKQQFSNPMYLNHYINHEKINRIMTIHSSKGLEADNVFIRFTDIPFYYNEEYKRKLYVAFTRAKNSLYISYKTTNIAESIIGKTLLSNFLKINNIVKK